MQKLLLFLVGIIAAGVVFLCVLGYQERERALDAMRTRVAAENAEDMAKLKQAQDYNAGLREQAQRDKAEAERIKAGQ